MMDSVSLRDLLIPTSLLRGLSVSRQPQADRKCQPGLSVFLSHLFRLLKGHPWWSSLLGLPTSTAGGDRSMPGWGIKIPLAMLQGQKTKNWMLAKMETWGLKGHSLSSLEAWPCSGAHK